MDNKQTNDRDSNRNLIFPFFMKKSAKIAGTILIWIKRAKTMLAAKSMFLSFRNMKRTNKNSKRTLVCPNARSCSIGRKREVANNAKATNGRLLPFSRITNAAARRVPLPIIHSLYAVLKGKIISGR
jgi:hypothetical protein